VLDWQGIHGAPHWARVKHNGLHLAKANGADLKVVELFAFLHDARRENDGRDPAHGERAAELVDELEGRFFSLMAAERRLLELACRDHSAGGLQADIPVQTCWDADRLDLGRVGKRPDPARLCTPEARRPDFLADCYRRSLPG
jgi:uncharacterized protein